MGRIKQLFAPLWGLVNTNTSGVPFILWAIAGASSVGFIFAMREELAVDTEKLYLVLAIALVWFIASDVIKKKSASKNSIHFFFDSVFYIILFSFLIYQAKGYSNGLFFIGVTPLISAPLFAGAMGGILFAFIFSITVFFAGHLPMGTENLTSYDWGFLLLQTIFCMIIVAMISFFISSLKKANAEKISFAQKEVDEKTKELRKTFDDLREKDIKLKEQLEELEKFQEIAVGRELKMIDLKKQLSELAGKMGNNSPTEK